MTKEEALKESFKFIQPYLKQDRLNDAQAARIGRTFFANLREAGRDKANV